MVQARFSPKLKERALRLASGSTSRVLVVVGLAVVVVSTLPLGVGLAVVYGQVFIHLFGPGGHGDGFDLLMLLFAPALVPLVVACLALDGLSIAFGWFVIASWRRTPADAAVS